MLKRLTAAVALMLAMVQGAAAMPDITGGDNGGVSYNFQMDGGRVIRIVEGKKYLEIQAENSITYRIYPCGKLEKLTWKELNPNEDRPTYTLSGTTLVSPYYINTAH